MTICKVATVIKCIDATDTTKLTKNGLYRVKGYEYNDGIVRVQCSDGTFKWFDEYRFEGVYWGNHEVLLVCVEPSINITEGKIYGVVSDVSPDSMVSVVNDKGFLQDFYIAKFEKIS